MEKAKQTKMEFCCLSSTSAGSGFTLEKSVSLKRGKGQKWSSLSYRGDSDVHPTHFLFHPAKQHDREAWQMGKVDPLCSP